MMNKQQLTRYSSCIRPTLVACFRRRSKYDISTSLILMLGAFPSSQDWDNSCEILAEADQIALAQEESLYKQEKDLASVNNAPLISDDTKPDEENISRGKSEESKRSAEEAEDKDKPLTEAEKEFARKQRLLQRMQ